MSSSSDVTALLDDWTRGNARALDRLLPLVYDELRRIAARQLRRERAGHTLQPTALVHEVWLRLAGEQKKDWAGRAQFFSAAAEAMRRILVERARKHHALKRGGGVQPEALDESSIAMAFPADELLAVHDALERLAVEDASAAELVKLRYFVGLSFEEAAEVLGVSVITAKRNWAYARAWLHHAIDGG